MAMIVLVLKLQAPNGAAGVCFSRKRNLKCLYENACSCLVVLIVWDVLNFTMIEVLIRANQKMSLLQRVKQFSLLSLEIEFIN